MAHFLKESCANANLVWKEEYVISASLPTGIYKHIIGMVVKVNSSSVCYVELSCLPYFHMFCHCHCSKPSNSHCGFFLKECDCHIPGVMGGINVCNPQSGQCLCKPSVGSRRCDSCKDGSYNLSEDNLFGCTGESYFSYSFLCSLIFVN